MFERHSSVIRVPGEALTGRQIAFEIAAQIIAGVSIMLKIVRRLQLKLALDTRYPRSANR